MPTLPGALLNWIELRFFDTTGEPLDSGTLTFYVTGTSTPKNTYTSSALTTANSNPVVLTASGRPSSPIFLSSGAYKVVVKDSSGSEQYTIDGIEDIGLTYFTTLGTVLATGDTAAVSGDSITTEAFVVVTDASGDNPATINLPAATSVTFPVTIKNLTAVQLQINPDGSDTIEGSKSLYTLPASAASSFPSVVLLSDGVSTWWIQASHDT